MPLNSGQYQLESEKGTFIHGKGIVYLLQTARFSP